MAQYCSITVSKAVTFKWTPLRLLALFESIDKVKNLSLTNALAYFGLRTGRKNVFNFYQQHDAFEDEDEMILIFEL